MDNHVTVTTENGKALYHLGEWYANQIGDRVVVYDKYGDPAGVVFACASVSEAGMQNILEAFKDLKVLYV